MPSDTDRITRKAARLGMRPDLAKKASQAKDDIGHEAFREFVRHLEKNEDEHHSVDAQEKYGA